MAITLLNNGKRALILDFDGVFVDSLRFHRDWIENVFGISLSLEQLRGIHEGNFHGNVVEDLKGADWTRYEKEILEEMKALPPRDDLHDTLEFFRQTHTMHIISSGGTPVIEAYLEEHHLHRYFIDVIGRDIEPSKSKKFLAISEKYGFNILSTNFITDTLGDVMEAHSVDVGTIIAIDFGYHSRETLERGNPHHIIASFNELKAIVA